MPEAELVAAIDCVRMLRYVRRVLIEDFEYDFHPHHLVKTTKVVFILRMTEEIGKGKDTYK